MRLVPARWFATLRARRRSVLCPLLAAFALSAASAPACAAMTAAAQQLPAVHEHDESHGGHHHGAARRADDADQRLQRCPHCPLAVSDANGGHASCAIADAQSSDAACAKSNASKPPLVPMDLRLPAASAAPPLIGTSRNHFESHTVTSSPILRHRVLLI